jgi:hypothetical protein
MQRRVELLTWLGCCPPAQGLALALIPIPASTPCLRGEHPCLVLVCASPWRRCPRPHCRHRRRPHQALRRRRRPPHRHRRRPGCCLVKFPGRDFPVEGAAVTVAVAHRRPAWDPNGDAVGFRVYGVGFRVEGLGFRV